MSLYNSCICYGCKINTKWYKSDTNIEVFGYICMPDFENASIMNITRDFLTESAMNVRYRMITSYAAQPSQVPVYVNMYRSIKGIFHKRELEPNIYGSTRTSGVASGGGATARIGVVQASASSDVSVRVYVTITYYCKLYGRVQLDVA